MKKLIEFQIRLMAGTIVMWIIASLLFGVDSTVYSITNIARTAVLIQGALLVITCVGWPNVVANLGWELIDWLDMVNDKYNIVTHISSEDVEIKTEEIPMSKKQSTNVVLRAMETVLRDLLPVGIEDEEVRAESRAAMNAEEQIRFDSLWMALDSVETSRMILLGKEFQKWNYVPSNAITVPVERIIEEA